MNTTNETREDYFKRKEENERRKLGLIYRDYFRERNCTDLKFTRVGSGASHDGVMSSGCSRTGKIKRIVIEYKDRNISFNRYSGKGCLAERKKLNPLYHLHQQGNTIFYIMDFHEYTVIFNLSSIFNEKSIVFEDELCTANSHEYQKGQEVKRVTYLPFDHPHTVYIPKFGK